MINDTKKKCLIISGGEYDTAGIMDVRLSYDLIIACDRGYAYAGKMGIRPDVLVSDFDSYSGPVEDDVIIKKHPSKKADTDTKLALKYAMEKGYERVDVICALGGRFDHTFANCECGVYAAARNVDFRILSSSAYLYFLNGKSKECNLIELEPKDGFGLSVFCLSGKCSGVNIKNAAYELQDAELTNDSSAFTGQSNEFADGCNAVISLSDGDMMIAVCRK